MGNMIIENGLKYILDSLHQMGSDNVFVIHYIYTGAELIFRSYLYANNYIYIFADMNQADRERLSYGNYEPVCYTESLDRLENLCDIQLSEKDKKALLELQRTKNSIEFSGDINEKAIQSVIIRTMDAILAFLDIYKTEFSISKAENDLIKKIKDQYAVLSEQHQLALKEADTLATGLCDTDNRIECPICGEEFLIPGNGKCHCYYCGYEADGETAARSYLFNVKGISERKMLKMDDVYPLYDCPACKKMAMVIVGDHKECFACGKILNGGKRFILNQAEGIAAAKQRGVKFGRPTKELPDNFDEVYQLYKDGQLTAQEAADRLNMAKTTFWSKGKNRSQEG